MCCLYCSAFIVVLFIFPFNITKGQSPDTANKSSFLSVKNYFKNEIKEDTHLYTGKEYYKYEAGITGFPFFVTNQMRTGDIFYEGTLYKDVPVLYDIVRQVLVINKYLQETRIQLLTEKIKYFIIDGHRFEIISPVEGEVGNKGLYDVAFTGKVSVLVKRVKSIKSGQRAEDPNLFREEDEYYLKKGKSVYNVSNKKDVLQAFDDKKDIVKIFIRKNNLKFKKDIEKDLITTAAYYSTLN
ncbi:MAG: hypothetical protein WKG06_04175 [Segetibacter sp.]